MDWCLLDGLVPLQMTFWFTVMLLIVGSGDDTGKSRRYKTGSVEPAYSFFHMSLSTGSTLEGLFCNRNMKTINNSSADVCGCECILVLRMSCGIFPRVHFNILFKNFIQIFENGGPYSIFKQCVWHMVGPRPGLRLWTTEKSFNTARKNNRSPRAFSQYHSHHSHHLVCSITQSEYRHNRSGKDYMLAQFKARHNHRPASVQLMASTRNTHNTTAGSAVYTPLCCTHRNYFLPRRLSAYYTYIPASFVRNSCELKRTKGEKLTLYLGNVRIYTVGQWFTKCAPRIPMDPRPVPKGSVDTFL